MKPRSKPGKVITGGRAARAVITHSKPLTQSQLAHLRKEKVLDLSTPKAGRGGKRAHWKLDYEEGISYDCKSIPSKEWESYSQEGIRRAPKRKGS